MMTIMSFINNGLVNRLRVLEPTEAIIAYKTEAIIAYNDVIYCYNIGWHAFV